MLRYLYHGADLDTTARELAALPVAVFGDDAEYVLGSDVADEHLVKLRELHAEVRRVRTEGSSGPAA